MILTMEICNLSSVMTSSRITIGEGRKKSRQNWYRGRK